MCQSGLICGTGVRSVHRRFLEPHGWSLVGDGNGLLSAVWQYYESLATILYREGRSRMGRGVMARRTHVTLSYSPRRHPLQRPHETRVASLVFERPPNDCRRIVFNFTD